jgi:hypothetical protein
VEEQTMSEEIRDPRTPPDCRNIQPEEFLQSTAGCQISYVMASDRVIDAHEREAIKAGARFTYFGHMSGETLLGSETSHGYLMTLTEDCDEPEGPIQHVWSNQPH